MLSYTLLFTISGLWLATMVGAVWVSVHLGHKKDMTLLGWIAGLMLGWIGVIIMVVIPPSPESQHREALRRGVACPYCHEPLRPGASVCPHCGRDEDVEASGQD